jgi:hypothetical protein
VFPLPTLQVGFAKPDPALLVSVIGLSVLAVKPLVLDSTIDQVQATTVPFIQLFPSSGSTGTQVVIEGAFLSTSDSLCTISSPTSANAVTGAACSLLKTTTGSFEVGNVPEGQYTIQVSGSAGDSAQAIFTVIIPSQTTIMLNPTSSAVGSTVQVYVSGFSTSDTS